MIGRIAVVAAATLALAEAAAAQGPAPDAGADVVPGRPLVGRDIARQRCATCHSIAGTRASPVPAAPRFSRLNRRFPIDSLGEALAEGIGVRPHANVQMPEFVFEPQEIEDLLAYLRSIQR